MADVFALLQRLAGSPSAQGQPRVLVTLATPATEPAAQGEGEPSLVAKVARVATASGQAVTSVQLWSPESAGVSCPVVATVVAPVSGTYEGSAVGHAEGLDIDFEERAAMAAVGGVPAPYVGAFARMQVAHPIRTSRERRARMIDDAGRFLDAWGEAAAGVGWTADDLFGEGGLVAALEGAAVTALSADTATLSDGGMYQRRI